MRVELKHRVAVTAGRAGSAASGDGGQGGALRAVKFRGGVGALSIPDYQEDKLTDSVGGRGLRLRVRLLGLGGVDDFVVGGRLEQVGIGLGTAYVFELGDGFAVARVGAVLQDHQA